MLEVHIPRVNLRVFSRALATLTKISESIIIESVADRLTICALSQTQSVYATFTFLHTFFTYFQHTAANTSTSRQRDREHEYATGSRSSSPSSAASSSRYFKVRVNSRVCCLPFRSALSSIDTVVLKLNDEDEEGFAELEGAATIENTSALIIQLRMISVGLTKTYRSATS